VLAVLWVLFCAFLGALVLLRGGSVGGAESAPSAKIPAGRMRQETGLGRLVTEPSRAPEFARAPEHLPATTPPPPTDAVPDVSDGNTEWGGTGFEKDAKGRPPPLATAGGISPPHGTHPSPAEYQKGGNERATEKLPPHVVSEEEMLEVGAAVHKVRDRLKEKRTRLTEKKKKHKVDIEKLDSEGELLPKTELDAIRRMISRIDSFLKKSSRCFNSGPASKEAEAAMGHIFEMVGNATTEVDGGLGAGAFPVPKSFVCSEPICYDAHDAEHIEVLRGKKLFIAFNLKNNEGLMPHYISEILRLVQALDREKVFVSVYESGSSDMTSSWMELLDSVLEALHIPHRVAYGNEMDKLVSSNQNRIKFLAQIRNRALEPLAVVQSDGTLGRVNPDVDVARDRTGKPMIFDQVIFLNDVYFCLSDIARLSSNDGDMACGLDFLTKDHGKFEVCEAHFGKYGYPNFGEDFQRARFYDFWVARTLNGQKFMNCPPYVRDSPDEVAAMAAGHPFQVSCCWNGLAVIRAEPLHRGLRFRNEEITPAIQRYFVSGGTSTSPFDNGDACAGSECSIMCQDLWALGYGKIVVDPSVKITYSSSSFRLRENFWPQTTSTIKNYPEYGRLRGEAVGRESDASSGFLPVPHWQPLGPVHECCPSKVQAGIVGWNQAGDCYFEDTSSPHFFETTPELPDLPTS